MCIRDSGSPLKNYEKEFRKLYAPIFFGLEVLQAAYYRNDRLRESFVAICADDDVQRITFDSYLYKKMIPASWPVQMKIFSKNIYHLIKGS